MGNNINNNSTNGRENNTYDPDEIELEQLMEEVNNEIIEIENNN